MKICYIITQLELGGAQLVVLKSLEYFSKSNEVCLITNQKGILNNEVLKMTNITKYFINSLQREINIFKDNKAKKEIIYILKKEKPDIVHTHSSKAGILGRIAAYKAKIPCIMHTVHGFGFHFFTNKIMKKIAIGVEKRVSKYCNKIIFVSKDDMQLAKNLRIGKEKQYEIVRAGVDFELYKNLKFNKKKIKSDWNIPENKKIILNIAPFKRQKNLMLFLEIINDLIHNKKRDIFAIIVGDGIYRKEMEKYINSHQLNKSILLTGFRNDVEKFLYISDIYLSTSLWEGLPRTILEALLSGLSVVAPNIGGIREVITSNINGFLYTPWEKEEAVKYLLDLIDDEILLKNISKNAKNSVKEEFSTNFMLKRLEEIYNDC